MKLGAEGGVEEETGIVVLFGLVLISGFVGVVEDADGPVDYREGEGADDETDASVKNGVFGFLELAGVALGGHVVYAANYNKYDGDDTHDGDDGV